MLRQVVHHHAISSFIINTFINQMSISGIYRRIHMSSTREKRDNWNLIVKKVCFLINKIPRSDINPANQALTSGTQKKIQLSPIPIRRSMPPQVIQKVSPIIGEYVQNNNMKGNNIWSMQENSFEFLSDHEDPTNIKGLGGSKSGGGSNCKLLTVFSVLKILFWHQMKIRIRWIP